MNCPVPRLWGLGALGTSVRGYSADKTTYCLTSAAVPRPEPSLCILIWGVGLGYSITGGI
jgi:hypothetical protein